MRSKSNGVPRQIVSFVRASGRGLAREMISSVAGAKSRHMFFLIGVLRLPAGVPSGFPVVSWRCPDGVPGCPGGVPVSRRVQEAPPTSLSPEGWSYRYTWAAKNRSKLRHLFQRITTTKVNETPIRKGSRSVQKVSAWSYDVKGHAKQCVCGYCESAPKPTSQLKRAGKSCLDDHQ